MYVNIIAFGWVITLFERHPAFQLKRPAKTRLPVWMGQGWGRHVCHYYCFRVGNDSFRAPSHFSVKTSRFFAGFAMIAQRIYLYYVVCFARLKWKAACTRAPTKPGLQVSRVILARVKGIPSYLSPG